PQAAQESDDRRRASGDFAERAALAIFYRLRTIKTAGGEVLHQRQKERQVGRRYPPLVQGQDEMTLRGVHQKIRILDAFGNSLIGQELADRVTGKKRGEVLCGDVGVDGHGAESRLSSPDRRRRISRQS